MDHPINQDWLSRDGMPARIVSGTGPYQCRLQAIGQDGVPVDDSGITDTLTAYDLNGAAHAVDAIVWVKPSPIPDGDGRTIYLIQSGGGSAQKDAVFLVTLAQDGGGNGGTSTNGTAATWTYTVKDYETGTTLKKNAADDDATAMSPVKPRQPWYATAATAGLACRKTNGDLVLVEAFESYDWGNC
jgi:hypothetical protein